MKSITGYCVLKLVLFYAVFSMLYYLSAASTLQDKTNTPKGTYHFTANIPPDHNLSKEKDPIKTSLYDVDTSVEDISTGNEDVSMSSADVNTEDDGIDAQLKGDDGDTSGIFLVPRTAKTFLRVRRWGIKLKRLWGEEQEEESESRENGREHARRVAHANACRSSCWGSWSAYSSCSTPCGSSGTKRSTRSRAPPSQCRAWVAQNGCPGPSVRTQACNRSCRNGGTLRPNDCSCPAGWTGRCCETRVRCGYPGKPSQGNVAPAGSSHNYGTVARFTCNTGYTRQGSAYRTCQNNGQWSFAVPTCQIVRCTDPGTPPHGSRQGTAFQYGRSVVYSCQEGYSLAGAATITCGANGRWSTTRPTCQPILCPAPTAGPGGSVSAPARHYQSIARYSCQGGYHLQGPAQRTCQLNGQWNGAQPSCNRIMCSSLQAPEHGAVSPASGQVAHGSQAQYTCSSGYQLVGGATRTCGGGGPEGVWSGALPSCQPASCGNPGVPTNGAKQGGVYTYGSEVSFQCQPGHRHSGGSERVTCQADGRWSGSRAECAACPPNTYKLGLNSADACTLCPGHSHTVATGSVSHELCVCDVGYTGPPGGPCTEILCPSMVPPAHGRVVSCDRHVNRLCVVTCNEGYVKSSGSESRQCGADGSWSGADLTCRACPENTYKSGPSVCSPCPEHSYTVGTGHGPQGCVCGPGYTGPLGGPCQDQDECSGVVSCAQTCVNTPGSYRCTCTLPGYVQDADNPNNCLAKNQCPALDSPDNSGLVCVGESSTNTERCEVKCNPGYEHPIRINDFEECGPSTNWLWSNQINNVPLLGCVEAYFAGVALEAEVAYFIEDCSALTADMQKQIALVFIANLQARGICIDGRTSTCNIEDVTIDCGAVVTDDFFGNWGDYRKKRSVNPQDYELRVKFKMAVPEVPKHQVNCSGFCNNVQVLSDYCQEACEVQHQNTSAALLTQAAQQLGRMFDTVRLVTPSPTRPPTSRPPQQGQRAFSRRISLTRPSLSMRAQTAESTPIHAVHRTPIVEEDNGLTLQCAGLTLVPRQGMRRRRPTSTCGTGMVRGDGAAECVPCPPGSHLPTNTTACHLCPPGTHQPHPKQTRCLSCDGTHGQSRRGATSCDQTLLQLGALPGVGVIHDVLTGSQHLLHQPER